MTTCKEPTEWYYTVPCEPGHDFPNGVPWRYSALRNAAIVACTKPDWLDCFLKQYCWHEIGIDPSQSCLQSPT